MTKDNLPANQPLTPNKNQHVEVIVLIPEISESDEYSDGYNQSKAAIEHDFRQSWHEAMTGQTIPVSELWEGLDDE